MKTRKADSTLGTLRGRLDSYQEEIAGLQGQHTPRARRRRQELLGLAAAIRQQIGEFEVTARRQQDARLLWWEQGFMRSRREGTYRQEPSSISSSVCLAADSALPEVRMDNQRLLSILARMPKKTRYRQQSRSQGVRQRTPEDQIDRSSPIPIFRRS